MLLMAAVLAADIGTEAAKEAAKRATIEAAKYAVKNYASAAATKKVIDMIVLRTARHAAIKLGAKTTVGFAKILGAIPLIGAGVGFAVDGGSCYYVATRLNFAVFDYGN